MCNDFSSLTRIQVLKKEKKMMLKITINSLLIFICLFNFTACLNKKTVVGKWQGDNVNETVEFFKDGTIAMQAESRMINGKYTILDESRLKMELGGFGALGGPAIVKYEFSGDYLTLTLQNNQAMKVKRVN